MGRRLKLIQKYDTPEGRRLWRIVDGAVKKAFDHHPDYLSTSAGLDTKIVRNSLVKRIVGDLLSSRKGEPTRD